MMDRGTELLETDGGLWEYWDNPVAASAAVLHRPFLPAERSDTVPAVERGDVAPAVEGARQCFLVVQLTGDAGWSQAGRELSLAAGDMAIFVGTRPRCKPGSRAHHQILRFSLDGAAEIHRETLLSLPALLPASHPATQLLVRMAEDLYCGADQLAAPLSSRFVGGLIQMLEATLEALKEDQAPPLSRMTRYHLDRIKSYLGKHVRDPGLTVKDVAVSLDMSVSHVHRIFAHEQCTVAEWLWSRRLEGCADDLGAFAHAHRTIGEIALSWGFNDLSHFSRVFRLRFGKSPKEWRNQAPWRQPLNSKP